ncbi:hypothetical protein Y032_0061g3240 [Ancylostoma ceylanicum]|uniref:Uncharacterized protein n=1 Tax=Ancylostoma ceylanicum TaxID=53326 RepID=A0A016U3R2_9BILA|nr:hypothetical protein Y032_0061g3240 [Ancylostoma ceylanicum]
MVEAVTPAVSTEDVKYMHQGCAAQPLVGVHGSIRSPVILSQLFFLCKFCEKFLRKDVYSYYNNNFVSQIGALGILTCIPLLVIYATCDRYAKRRQQMRVEKHLEGAVISHKKSVNREAVASLLHGDEE